ncbi:hypothetical protein FEM48_Zijuj09G0043600 [Ziziphus jujuba var. spinosa]|uniref:Uncharacterized protein n=1 Tax=Ziziphus jujuba var. spinosa TaxID=714518 RepID=A0A978UQV5_ZIZJJ|nr:hypothetical protein FEM48_Zijuj09G0043600 [Ziziphus jujuba var. spinosa]
MASSVSRFDSEFSLEMTMQALRGKQEAFLYLHSICSPISQSRYSYTKRSRDSRTILHAAIAREYFDLAYKIIHLYADLVNDVDENGFTPLHVLAAKSSAFKCGIIVKELKAGYPSNSQSEDRKNVVENLNRRNEQEGSSSTDEENPVSKDQTGSQSTTCSAESNSLSWANFLLALLVFFFFFFFFSLKRVIVWIHSFIVKA